MSARNEVKIQTGDWAALGQEATRIRHEVFVREQQVPLELELDEMDAQCEHALAWLDGKAVGTARLLPDGHIGRMAVLAPFRGRGVGAALLQALVTRAADLGHAMVRLNAQLHATAFYERFGFVAYGEVFDDAGIAHIAMQMTLKS